MITADACGPISYRIYELRIKILKNIWVVLSRKIDYIYVKNIISTLLTHAVVTCASLWPRLNHYEQKWSVTRFQFHVAGLGKSAFGGAIGKFLRLEWWFRLITFIMRALFPNTTRHWSMIQGTVQSFCYLSTCWRHQKKALSALLALCEGNPPVTGGFPPQRPATRSFDGFYDLHLNNRGAGGLKHHRAHYDIAVMSWKFKVIFQLVISDVFAPCQKLMMAFNTIDINENGINVLTSIPLDRRFWVIDFLVQLPKIWHRSRTSIVITYIEKRVV